MPQPSAPSARTRLVREPDRAVYDRTAAYKILDEGFICHVGFVLDGQPFVIPTGYGRVGDNLYFHGSAASRMLRRIDEGIPVCVTVTLLDGLVLARSIFNHSMNYRSVVVLGTARAVPNPEEKLEALRLLSEQLSRAAGRNPASPTRRNSKLLRYCSCRLTSSQPRCGKARPSTTRTIILFRRGREWCR